MVPAHYAVTFSHTVSTIVCIQCRPIYWGPAHYTHSVIQCRGSGEPCLHNHLADVRRVGRHQRLVAKKAPARKGEAWNRITVVNLPNNQHNYDHITIWNHSMASLAGTPPACRRTAPRCRGIRGFICDTSHTETPIRLFAHTNRVSV